MKFGFKLKDIQLGEVRIGEVEVNTDFSINEMVAMRKEAEYLIENLPVYMEQLGTAFITGLEINRAVEEYIEDINTDYEETEEDCESEGLTHEELMGMFEAVARQEAMKRIFRK